VENLFDVKLRAIENMHEAGIEIALVVTIVNGVNQMAWSLRSWRTSC